MLEVCVRSQEHIADYTVGCITSRWVDPDIGV